MLSDNRDVLDDLLSTLSSRLHEIAWKLGQNTKSITFSMIPQGLFRSNLDSTGLAYIDEIHQDIALLARQNSAQRAQFIAENIQKKIAVLVSLCRQSNTIAIEEKELFNLSAFTTRRQHVSNLEHAVSSLIDQRECLQKTLEQKKGSVRPEVLVRMQSELGALEQRLTLAREALKKFITP